jgi:Zn-dependent protease
VIYALDQPAALVGLLLAFLLALVLRATTQRLVWSRVSGWRSREPLFNPRRDIDPFGAVAAAFGGTGWGRPAPTGPDGRARPLVLLAGPLAVLVASQIMFAVYRVAIGPVNTALNTIEIGLLGSALVQFLISMATGLLWFSLLALIPLPPLDGWGLLKSRMGPRPSAGFAKAQYWLEDQNVGVVILLVGMILPLGLGNAPFLVFILERLTVPFFLLWGF